MPAIKYQGRASGGVTLELPDGPIHVPHGESVDVPDDIAKELLQSTQWTKGAKTKTINPDTED